MSGKIIFSFSEYPKDDAFQILEYDMGWFWPETVRQGLLVADVNGDSCEDLIMDLGIWGKRRYAVCVVYDTAKAQYSLIDKFDDLFCPEWHSGLNSIIATIDNNADSPAYGYERYQICGTELELIGSITCLPINDWSDAIITEIEYNGGTAVQSTWSTQEETRNIETRWGSQIDLQMRLEHTSN